MAGRQRGMTYSMGNVCISSFGFAVHFWPFSLEYAVRVIGIQVPSKDAGDHVFA